MEFETVIKNGLIKADKECKFTPMEFETADNDNDGRSERV